MLPNHFGSFGSSEMNNYSQIYIALLKTNTTIQAIQDLEYYKNLWNYDSNFTCNNVEIGDEGFNITKNYSDLGYVTGIIYFRISNYIYKLECWDKDYTFIFNLSKIVEQRIYDSMG